MQTSLLSQKEDGLGPSPGFDLFRYEPKRFGSDAEMEAQILDWSARPDLAEPLPGNRPQ